MKDRMVRFTSACAAVAALLLATEARAQVTPAAGYTPPDDTPRIKSQCSAKVPGCALERIPVHVHPLRPASR